jgi:hypothetical protein
MVNIRTQELRVALLLRVWIIAVMIVLLIALPTALRQVEGQVVTVAVDQNSVRLNMDLVLTENLTTLPVINSYIGSANSTSVTQPFLNAISKSIQNQVAAARVSDFGLNVKTTSTGTRWVLEESYSLTIVGANANSGSHTRSDLGFLAMDISQSLTIGSVETNGIGPTYLLPALDQKAANYSNLIFFIDGSNPRNVLIPDQTTKQFWLLDFSWVSPISTWTKTTATLDQTSQWTLTPNSPRYNLTLGIPSPEGVVLASFVVIYSPSLTLTAPGYAWTDGSSISFDAATPAETIAPTIILALVVLLVVTLALNRRITRPLRRTKR